MINRILLILKTQDLSSSQFADEIGVQRSSISHILSGRNNPSLEFVTKILKRFPDINSDWIIFGKGSMYKGSNEKIVSETKEIKKQSSPPDLFNFDDSEQQLEIEPIEVAEITDTMKYESLKEEKNEKEVDIITENQLFKEESEYINTDNKKEQIKITDKKEEKLKPIQKSIERIVIFYSDKTFKEYYPE